MALQDDPTAPASPVDRDGATPGKGLAEEHARESVRALLFGSGSRVKCGRFEVRGQLGAGGMGEVFEGWDPDLERKVALKVLHAAQSDDAAGRKRLVREAQTLARLRHPNVVAVYEVGEDRGRMFVAMELVEGTTLREWLEERRSQEEIVEVFRQAAAGLQAAHDAGLVHRDFKPDNVMVTGEGDARVVDFGLARAGLSERRPEELGVEETSLTVTGTLAGTPAYMSPEQLEGKKAGAASDQFSFCVALYTALYGEPPFAGKTFGALRAAVLAGQVRAPNGNVPPRIRTALLKGLQVEVEQRFASMNALVGALEPKPSRARWLLAGALAATCAGAVAYASRGEPVDAPADRLMHVCTDPDSLLERWTSWEPGLDRKLDGLYPGGVDDMHATGRDLATAWETARDTVCQAESPSRGQLECLDQMRGMLTATMAQTERVDELELVRATVWSLLMLTPETCIQAAPLYDAYPAGTDDERHAAWQERAAAYSMLPLQWNGEYEMAATQSAERFDDPVAEITRSIATFLALTRGPPRARHLRDGDVETLARYAEQAEEVGAQYMALSASMLRLLASMEGLPAWQRVRLLGTIRSRASQLDWDPFAAGILANQAAMESELEAADALLLQALERVRGPAYVDVHVGYVQARVGLYVGHGRYAEAAKIIDDYLASVHPEDVRLGVRNVFFAEPDFADVQIRLARRAEVLEEYRAHGRELPPLMNPLWLDLDPLRTTRDEAMRVVEDASADDASDVAVALAIELQDYERAQVLMEKIAPEEAEAFALQIANEQGRGQEHLAEVSKADGHPRTWVERAIILADAGQLQRARALAESSLLAKSNGYIEDLYSRAHYAFVLATILERIGPEHHERAVALARGALSMYEFGGSDLFPRRQTAIRTWLDEHPSSD